MSFTVDHAQAKEFEPIKPGEYEVVVLNYELTKTSTDKNQVSVDYEIRSDVEQPCQGQKILYDNFTVTETAMWKFHSASKAAGLPNGKQYASFKSWAEEFMGKSLRLVVGDREYNGKKYVQVKSYKPSKAAEPLVFTISDEDVPF